MRARAVALALLLAAAPLLLAGCVGEPRSVPPASTSDHGADDARMSATVSVTEDSRLRAGVPPYEATRVVEVEGRIALDALDVALSTVNGDVTLTGGREGAWSMIVTMTATGATAAEAEARRDTMTLRWAHEDRGRHFLRAEVEFEEERDSAASSRSADLEVVLPASVLVTLAMSTVNGDVEAKAVRAARAALSTVNGDVALEASDVIDASGSATSGDVTLAVRPAADGGVAASTVNGDAHVRVPEGARWAYDASASTVNGDARIDLKDGEGARSGGFGSSSASFRSHGYGSREADVAVAVSSVNGDAVVASL